MRDEPSQRTAASRLDFQGMSRVLAGLTVLFPGFNYVFRFVSLDEWYPTTAPALLTATATVTSLFVFVASIRLGHDSAVQRRRWLRAQAAITFLVGFLALFVYVDNLGRAEELSKTIGLSAHEERLDQWLPWVLPLLYTTSSAAITRAFCLLGLLD